jgi:hypothetical protein
MRKTRILTLTLLISSFGTSLAGDTAWDDAIAPSLEPWTPMAMRSDQFKSQKIAG